MLFFVPSLSFSWHLQLLRESREQGRQRWKRDDALQTGRERRLGLRKLNFSFIPQGLRGGKTASCNLRKWLSQRWWWEAGSLPRVRSALQMPLKSPLREAGKLLIRSVLPAELRGKEATTFVSANLPNFSYWISILPLVSEHLTDHLFCGLYHRVIEMASFSPNFYPEFVLIEKYVVIPPFFTARM